MFRIVAHDAVGVGDVDAEVERLFLQPPDGRFDRALAVGFNALREASVRQAVGQQVVTRQFGKQLRGVDHHVFHRIAHAGFDFGHEHAQQEPA